MGTTIGRLTRAGIYSDDFGISECLSISLGKLTTSFQAMTFAIIDAVNMLLDRGNQFDDKTQA